MAVLWSVATLLCGLAADLRSDARRARARRRRRGGLRQRRHRGHHQRLSRAPPRDADRRLHGRRACGTGAGRRRRRRGRRDARLAHGVRGDRHRRPGCWRSIYPLVVREARLRRRRRKRSAHRSRFANLGALFAGRALNCAYVGSGLQLFVAGALPAWLPTYFVRYYDLPLKPGDVARRDVPRAWRRRDDRVRHDQRQVRARTSAARALLSAFYCLGCAGTSRSAFAVGPGSAAARAARHRHVPGGRIGGTVGRDGCRADSRGAPRHRLCRTHAGQQCVRTGARARSSPAGSPTASACSALFSCCHSRAWPRHWSSSSARARHEPQSDLPRRHDNRNCMRADALYQRRARNRRGSRQGFDRQRSASDRPGASLCCCVAGAGYALQRLELLTFGPRVDRSVGARDPRWRGHSDGLDPRPTVEARHRLQRQTASRNRRRDAWRSRSAQPRSWRLACPCSFQSWGWWLPRSCLAWDRTRSRSVQKSGNPGRLRQFDLRKFRDCRCCAGDWRRWRRRRFVDCVYSGARGRRRADLAIARRHSAHDTARLWRTRRT